MKEIKAYIRRKKAEEVIHALEEAEVPGFTAVEVRGIGHAAVPEGRKWSIEYADEYSPITKLEVICKNQDVQRLINLIREKAYTGHKGDGMIFVSSIDQCIKIRTGECDEEALIPGPDKTA